MDGDPARRAVLRGLAALGGIGSAGIGTAGARTQKGEFAPTEHAFGFRNWSNRSGALEPPREDPSNEDIREEIRVRWTDRLRTTIGGGAGDLPDALVGAIATQLRQSLVQRAGTNGHCYGICLAAQQYFENPEGIPLARRTAAEIEHPTEPLDAPDAPVYDDILRLQAQQFLRFRAWLGRRSMLHPKWIDVEAQLRDVRAVIETFGTATVTVFGSARNGHQLLAYDYEERPSGVALAVYDPNRKASSYRADRPVLEFDRDEDGLSMSEYRGYAHFLFNRYDRIESATDRSDASPVDHLDVDPDRLSETLFPVALVMADTADVHVVVACPDGEPLGRTRSEFMASDRRRSERVRFRYGVDPGEYRLAVVGRRSTEYDLSVLVAGPGGARLDASWKGAIDAGETHTYLASVPNGATDDGSLERDADDRGLWPFAAAAAGGALAGIGAYHAVDRPRSGENDA